MHCVDLGESFPTHIYLQNVTSIQPRTSLVKFARSPRTDPPGSLRPSRLDKFSSNVLYYTKFVSKFWHLNRSGQIACGSEYCMSGLLEVGGDAGDVTAAVSFTSKHVFSLYEYV